MPAPLRPPPPVPRAAEVPVVVIGGSAGALPALLEIARGLPADFPGVVLVAMHLLRGAPSMLAELLGRAGPLPAHFAVDGEPLEPGHIFVAPPDHHLQVELNSARLTRGPRENQSRPSIDVLFRSAAQAHGARVSGVLLSGLLSDGASGLWTIKQLGGCAVVQHPEEAEYSSMPMSAIQEVDIDDILPAAAIAGRLSAWAQAVSVREKPAPPSTLDLAPLDLDRLALEVQIAAGATGSPLSLLEREPLSPLACPECHGVMVRIEEGGRTRFRCHTGHAFAADHLLSGVRRNAEEALWSAVRAFDEEMLLLGQLRAQAEARGQPDQTGLLQREYHRALHDSSLLRELLMGRAPGGQELG